jgi:hypothetical protein
VSLLNNFLAAFHQRLTRYLYQEVIMSFVPSSSVVFAAPPAVAASLMAFLVANLVRLNGDLEAVQLTQRLGPEGGDYGSPLFYVGAMVLSEAEIALIRSEFREGGALYDAGCRARRLLFPPTEVAAPATVAGKLTVEVLENLPIPSGLDWSVTRLAKDAFFGELGLPGAPLVVLDPPEENILRRPVAARQRSFPGPCPLG